MTSMYLLDPGCARTLSPCIFSLWFGFVLFIGLRALVVRHLSTVVTMGTSGAPRSAGSAMLLCHSQNLQILCEAGKAVGPGMTQPLPSGPGGFCGGAAGPGWGWCPRALSPHWLGELSSREKVLCLMPSLVTWLLPSNLDLPPFYCHNSPGDP